MRADIRHHPWTGLIALILCLLFSFPALAQQGAANAAGTEHVRLQLKWNHQFQFAGYYAAVEQGFYREEGLDVELIEGGVTVDPVQNVLAGEAEYGVAASDIIQARMRGEPVVVVAPIFRHSPHVLMAMPESGINTPDDLLNKRIMASTKQEYVKIMAMLIFENVPVETIEFVPHNENVQLDMEALITGQVDAVSVYSTFQPFLLQQQGIEPNLIQMHMYGIDFYGDSLFTSEKEAEENHERVAAMMRATIKGWEYAMNHPDELIDFILEMPSVRERGVTRETLEYEAKVMRPLIQPELGIGNNNPRRWERMGEVFKETGMVEFDGDLEGFFFDPTPPHIHLPRWLWIGLGVVLTMFLLLFVRKLELARIVANRTAELRKEIEQREKVESALRANEAQLTQIASNIPGTVFQFTLKQNQTCEIPFISGRIEELFGISQEETHTGPQKLFSCIDKSDLDRLKTSLFDSAKHQTPWNEEFRIETPKGQKKWLSGSAHPTAQPDKSIIWDGIMLDITERKFSQEELIFRSEFERRLSMISANFIRRNQDNLGAGISESLQMVGEFLESDALCVGFFEGIEQEEPETFWWRRNDVRLEVVFGREESNLKWLWSQLHHVGVIQISSPEDLAPEAAGFAKTMRRAGIRSMIIVGLMDRNSLVGYLAVQSQDRSIRQTRDCLALLQLMGQIISNALERVRYEQERVLLDSRILQAQKMESLGVLAGGIAHDFNNLLVGVMGNASMAMMDLPPESPVIDSIRQIEDSAQRAAELTRQMLAFSGKGRFVLQPINLSVLVEEMTYLMCSSISKNAVMRFHLEEKLPLIEADATQIRQMIMNLVVNASEAIGGRSGVVSVTTGSMQCDRAYLQSTYLSEERPEGSYVFLEISDNGVGMEAGMMEKIFDPFFTTKFTGRGLGLAAVLGIVRSHHGAIKVYSEVTRGTTFKVLFPQTDRHEPRTAPIAIPTNLEPLSGTILVVDDEENVRRLAERILMRAGYKVDLARDGAEGVRLFAIDPKRYAAVVLDMTMPKMDGVQAFREMRRHDPGVRVILSSGYNEADATSQFAGKGLSGFIQKPYRPVDLIELLSKVLGRAPDKNYFAKEDENRG